MYTLRMSTSGPVPTPLEPAPGVHNQAELAYYRLRERLLEGRHPAGEKIIELALCEELGMSRTPVREAIRRLQSEGILTPTGRGVVVSSLSDDDMRHAMQLQGTLEALAARLAAAAQRDGLLSPAHLRELRAASARVEQVAARQDLRAAWRANLDFHMLLARFSGNPLLVEALDRIWVRFAVVSHGNISARTAMPRPSHAEIIAAISAGDPGRAAEAAAGHVQDAADLYEKRQE
ncbi:GntR family transcriptional regulator [Streptomyces sp. HGB0020]|uniref:GntR family transcriptional regulator n=2 Tax=Streptomyces TaxID=1883 RepID=UPI0009977A41|nr:GntR family transcriptional regulator [Streptomyces sp. HGB0020]